MIDLKPESDTVRLCPGRELMTSVRPLFPILPIFTFLHTIGTFMYLLRELQFDMARPRTACKQVPIHACLFSHLCMHCISPSKFVLVVAVIRHSSCKKGLFARISIRAGIGGRRAGKLVESERERQRCDGDVEATLLKNR